MQIARWLRRAAGTLRPRGRLGWAAVIGLLFLGPLITGDGEAVILNAAGFAWAGLLAARFAGLRNTRRTDTTRRKR